jgi:hypothetical protein
MKGRARGEKRKRKGQGRRPAARVASWALRVAAVLARMRGKPNHDFVRANAGVIRKLVVSADVGARMVVNIRPDALLSFLASRQYQNLYDRPRVGGKLRKPSRTRLKIDELLGLGDDAARTYFGAVAMGGAGVRYYGNYCMVLRRSALGPETRLFDRDSYDLLIPPLSKIRPLRAVVARLRGTWAKDLASMAVIKLMPLLEGADRIRTTGNISDEILKDQEYIEIHKLGAFGVADIEEIRLAPEDYAIAAHDRWAREAAGSPTSAAHLLWSDRHRDVLKRLAQASIPTKVVSLHGRGYQWA